MLSSAIKTGLKGPIRLAIVGAAGNVGTHVAALWINGIRAYYQEKNRVARHELEGLYSDKLLQKTALTALLDNALEKFEPTESLPIQLDLILHKSNSTESSSTRFNLAKGFGFYPAPCDEQENLRENLRVEIPKQDCEKLGVRIIDNLEVAYQENVKYHLIVAVVTEKALLDDRFCEQLGQVIHSQGQLALSMNGLPPYFLELIDDPVIRSCHLKTNQTKGDQNVLELLGGANKIIGVVLTVADGIQKISKPDGDYHISVSSKTMKACKLGSRQVVLDSPVERVLPDNFFQSLGIAVGLGTQIEKCLDDAILQKLAVNFVLNSISALKPVRIFELLNDASVKKLITVLNEQFAFMITRVLKLPADILYKGDSFIVRLAMSENHIASTGQSVIAKRQVEYTNLMAFLDLVLQVAEKRSMTSVRNIIDTTITLFSLFKSIHDHLDAFSHDSAYPISEQIENLSMRFALLLKEAEQIASSINPALQYSEQNRSLLTNHLIADTQLSIAQLQLSLESSQLYVTQIQRYIEQVKSANRELPASVQEELQATQERATELISNIKSLSYGRAHTVFGNSTRIQAEISANESEIITGERKRKLDSLTQHSPSI